MAVKFERTQLDLMRHGETLLPGAVCGVTDVALSEKGWRQMRENTENLLVKNKLWDALYYSPLIRCAQFAEEIANRYELEAHCLDDLREINFGRWEGLEFEEVDRLYPGQWAEWMKHPSDDAPHGAENYFNFQNRIAAAADSVLAQSKGKRILLIGHGGVIRAIMAHTLGLSSEQLFKISVGYACMSRISAYHQVGEKDWFQLDAHNFT